MHLEGCGCVPFHLVNNLSFKTNGVQLCTLQRYTTMHHCWFELGLSMKGAHTCTLNRCTYAQLSIYPSKFFYCMFNFGNTKCVYIMHLGYICKVHTFHFVCVCAFVHGSEDRSTPQKVWRCANKALKATMMFKRGEALGFYRPGEEHTVWGWPAMHILKCALPKGSSPQTNSPST